MRRPSGTNETREVYWRNGREHASGYQNNDDARLNWEQGYGQGTRVVEEGPHPAETARFRDDETHYDERSWSGYASPPGGSSRQTREGAGMQPGTWRGEGWGREAYRGGIRTANYESPFMHEARPAAPSAYGGQPRGNGGTPQAAAARGPHTGKGPKGYQRSDERIREDVCERLTDHHDVDASDIEVAVEGGEITLTGLVTERREKLMAEHIAEGVGGVVDIHNQLRVRREGAPNARSVVPAPGDKTKS